MKIDLLTFHFVSNDGGVLQCYALQRFLEKQGHQVQVIDYRPSYHTVRYNAVKNPFIYTRWYWRRFRNAGFIKRNVRAARSFVRCLFLNVKPEERTTAQIFDGFVRKNLHLTEQYTTLKQLQENPPQADAYVVGSDQLWNPDLLDFEFDPAYFLDFGNNAIPHVAYAVSTGKQPNETELTQIEKLCGRLSAISIREYNERLIKAMGQDVHVCIDPTLLLEADDYSEIEGKEAEKEPYIFVYGFEDNEDFHDAVNIVRKKLGIRIINGCPHRIHLDGDVTNLRECGPSEFLGLIKNAQYVVTNSFHGTAFSIVYKKEFVTLAHSTRASRMTELLSKLGLLPRLWGNESFSIDNSIDWSHVEEKRSILQKHSREYLLSAITGKRGDEISHCDAEYTQVNIDKGFKAFAGYMTDKEELKSSASGGAGAAMSKTFIENGGVVIGAAYTDEFKAAEYIIVEKKEDLCRLKGSKYISARKKSGDIIIYEKVQNLLTNGRRVLFTGLPCDVGALYSWLENRGIQTENLITVDLICHGCTSEKVQQFFVDSLEKKYSASMVQFSTRYVNKSWSLPYIYAKFKNGKVFKNPLYETDFGFALKYYVRPSCFHCKFKGDNHRSDITIGDYWGLNPKNSLYNKNGVSVIIVRSHKGLELIERIDREMFNYTEVDFDALVKHNPMYMRSTKKPAFYDSFEKDLNSNGLHDAVSHSRGYGVYKKAAIKNRLLLMLGKK